jgi:hypothetical protein
MIVVNLEGIIMGEAPEIIRVNTQGEENLIKVNVNPNEEFGYYYIGTDDRDDYSIIDIDTPDPNKQWRYIDGEFIEDPLDR